MQHCGGSPQQFCLRWNNYQSNLTNVFDQLLQSESFVDVTLACDNHSVKAHKMVLSACSPYFQSLFFDNPCQHPIVILKDIKWPELKAVVEFMYKGEINVSQEQIGPLLKVAESLKIRGLADVNGEPDSGLPPPAPGDGGGGGNKKWEPRQPQDLSETAMSPSPSQLHRHKKRRRVSGERSTPASSPEQHVAAAADALETSALELGSPHNAMANNLPPPPPPPPPSNHPMGPTMVPLPGDQGLSLPPPSHPDEMEIKPGIAEMIREEERAKMLESSHAWLGASTSSIANHPALLKLKAPMWTQSQLKEAIQAVVTQKMRFTQAATYFGIPKGTLYDNILGKSKRMVVLEEAGLNGVEEQAVLEFCCAISIQPYNRRTNKSLQSVLSFVEKLRRARDPEFQFTGLAGFRWWWAFCKKHSIASLYFERSDEFKWSIGLGNSEHPLQIDPESKIVDTST